MIRLERPIRATAALLLALFPPAGAAWAQVDTGSADFTAYVAMGDSLTAGVTSAGLAQSAQESAYPLLVHRQATGSTTWEQPWVSDPGLPPLLELVSLSPLVVAPKAGLGQPTNLFLPRPYDNLGVPGADVHDVLATVTDNGGAHDLVLRGLGTQLQLALALQPTFVTLWIGNNDALAAATSGLVIDDVTLTTLASFEADYRTVVGAIAGSGAQLAVGTVPNVTSIPFVTTIPPFVQNPFTGDLIPLLGPSGPLGAGDFVLLTASTLLAQGSGIPVELGGTGLPLPDQVVLSAAEASTIQNRVNGFNGVIRTVAQEVGAALVDANVVFDGIVANGVEYGGIVFGADYLTGGIFSYDGVHPTTFGYAIVANEFIRAINETFDAGIQQVDLFDYVFGEAGRLPQITAAQASQAIWTRGASQSLAWTLGLPDVTGLTGPPGGGPGTSPPGDAPGVRPGPGAIPPGMRAPRASGQPPAAPPAAKALAAAPRFEASLEREPMER